MAEELPTRDSSSWGLSSSGSGNQELSRSNSKCHVLKGQLSK